MLRIGLTGGIATGKSYVLHRFAASGVPTADADLLARQAVAPRTPGLAAIVRRFGSDVLTADGALDRQHIGRIVFADPAARADLEAIVHPEVYRLIHEWAARVEADGAAFAIADIPLLYETRHEADFDYVVVIACQPEEQLGRLMARDVMTEEDARQRLAAQLPLDVKIARADYVIRTDGSFADTDAQVDACYRWLASLARSAP